MNRWLEIDLKAVKHNIETIKKEINWPKVKLMPVVKANAYGHGAVEIAKVCEKEKVDFLAVATFDEAKTLRENDIETPILIIGYTDSDEIEEVIKNDITMSVYDLEMAGEIIKVAKKLKKIANIHLKLDSGMHRLGFMPDEFVSAYKKLANEENLNIDYLYTHFAEITNNDFTKKQLEVLDNILDQIKKEKLPLLKVHVSRSEGLKLPKTYYDMVRPGLAIYGLSSLSGLTPALTFKTKIAQVKDINKGEFVGYSLTFKAKKDMKIATIAVGYSDGYGRNLSNKGEVIVNGVKCPVIGRVCMNLAIINVDKVKNIEIGDEVILIGKYGNVEVSAIDLAKKINTIPYEIVSRIPGEIPRMYK